MRQILGERGNLERFGVELDRSRSRQKNTARADSTPVRALCIATLFCSGRLKTLFTGNGPNPTLTMPRKVAQRRRIRKPTAVTKHEERSTRGAGSCQPAVD
jgi:hypothetical protein